MLVGENFRSQIFITLIDISITPAAINTMFWKKEKPVESELNNNILLAMVMLRGENTFNTDVFNNELEVRSGREIKEPAGDNCAFAFEVQGESVVIGHMPVPIPSDDLESTATYAYNWTTALLDTAAHKSHLIVSMIRGGTDQIKRYRIFTEIICAVLRTSDAIGVYQGGQSLLITSTQYLQTAELMDDDYLPLDLWMYFGLVQNETGNWGYTYGLKQFNKPELEIVHSAKSLEDIRNLLFDTAAYVVKNGIHFRDGQTCGFSAEERIRITYSKGVFLEDNTFKLAY